MVGHHTSAKVAGGWSRVARGWSKVARGWSKALWLVKSSPVVCQK